MTEKRKALKPWSVTMFIVVNEKDVPVETSLNCSDEGALRHAAIRESYFCNYKRRMKEAGYRVVPATITFNRRATRRKP